MTEVGFEQFKCPAVRTSDSLSEVHAELRSTLQADSRVISLHNSPDNTASVYLPTVELDFSDVEAKKIAKAKCPGKPLMEKEDNQIAPSVSDLMCRIDHNHNGRITRDEIKSALAHEKLTPEQKHDLYALNKNYDNIDRNGNGVSLQEIRRFDRKNEYTSSVRQFDKIVALRFEQLDHNHNGVVNGREINRAIREATLSPQETSVLRWATRNLQ
ncbi:MAG TPA: hypothetical protein V6D17_10890 [Candidatus Obscuribacterales bacterium]